jgi:molybdenum cofactor cytidylyltransferase
VISALILAAGQSQRMGRPKMSLAWGETTVLGHVIDVFHAAGVSDVLVVSGGDRAAVEEIAASCGVRAAFNAQYADQEMLTSLQVGLRAMAASAEGCFVALGDQPQIEPGTVRAILDLCDSSPAPLIVPSYGMRRGHPWLARRAVWDDILRMSAPLTPRDFLREHADLILHVNVNTPTILADLDTPDDYLKSRT